MCKPGLWSSPKDISRLILRVSFGLSLFFVGVVHYRTAADFAKFVGDGLGPITQLGTVWGYILPGLMIVGGALFVIGMFPTVAVWVAGIALASIPAGVLLKAIVAPATLGDNMAGAVTAFTWLNVYMFAVKSFCGCGMKKCCDGKDMAACCDGKKNCGCAGGECKGDCKGDCCK